MVCPDCGGDSRVIAKRQKGRRVDYKYQCKDCFRYFWGYPKRKFVCKKLKKEVVLHFKKEVEKGEKPVKVKIEIAKSMEVSIQTLSKWIREIDGVQKKRISNKDKEKILEMYKRGIKQKQISSMLGISKSTISRIINQNKFS